MHSMYLRFIKIEVANHLEKRIEVVRSDRREEYYGRHDEGNQLMRPSPNYL